MIQPILAVAGDNIHAMVMTMCTAIAAGTFLIVIARRLNIPAIVLLLIGGVLLGPDVWDRLFGVAAPVRADVLGDGLMVIVSMAIGLILFEGGLTLDISGYKSAPKMIKRLLTFGVGLTWIGIALTVYFSFRWFGEPKTQNIAIIAGSLVIVTGPTVIAPLLKRIKITSRLHNILHWEGVLIDPIGVFIALLCYEYVSSGSGSEAFLNLGVRVSVGLVDGLAGGFLLIWIIKKKLVPEEMINVFTFGWAVAVFGVAELARAETGLLSVTIAGFVFGFSSSSKMKQVKQFKAEITDLLIGMLFILLASRLEFAQFKEFGIAGLVAVLVVVFVIRPMSIFLCGLGSGLELREKALLAWIAPRGIVAASMASLIALNLEDRFVETFTYSVIIATIMLQGSTAGMVSTLLGVKRPEPTGWLIVGAHEYARRIAEFLTRTGSYQTVLIDSSARAVRGAKEERLNVFVGDARDTSFIDRPDLQGIGNVLALTDNEDLNVRICQNWKELLGPDHVYRSDPNEMQPANDDIDHMETAGRVVMARLPKPTLLSAELARGDATVVIHDAELNATPPSDAIPIANIHNGKATLDPPHDMIEHGKTMFIVREADYLMRAIRPELITTVEADSLETLFGELIDRVVRVQPTVPRDVTIEELLDREHSFPTVLGHGVAVPHAYSESLEERVCAIAQVPGGISFSDHPAAEPVHLVFMLLSPQGDPEGHLATLAEIARLVIRPDVRDQLLASTSPLEAIRVIRKARA